MIFKISLLLLPICCFSQIGINTVTPMHTLSVGTSTDPNAVVFTKDGQLGINNNQPNAKLDIVGKLQIQDGTQGDKKTLVSDAHGNVSWGGQMATTSDLKIAVGTFSTGIDFKSNDASKVAKYTGATITLGPGDWLVKYSLIAKTNSVVKMSEWVNFPITLTKVAGVRNADYNTNSNLDHLVANKRNYINFQGSSSGTGANQKLVKSTGDFIVSNPTSAPVTYYLVAEPIFRYSRIDMNPTFVEFASSSEKQNTLLAFPISLN